MTLIEERRQVSIFRYPIIERSSILLVDVWIPVSGLCIKQNVYFIYLFNNKRAR